MKIIVGIKCLKGITKTGVLRLPLRFECLLRALFGQRCKGFHQAALAARDGVLVQHTLFSSLIQSADGLHDSLLGFGGVAGENFARGVIGSAGSATDIAVTQAALFVLTIAFDLRLNVSQGLPPNILSVLSTATYFTWQGLICPVNLKENRGQFARGLGAYGVAVAALMGVGEALGRTVPGPGVMGVLVGGRVAVGVTILTGIVST